jgi:hypothetical protein
VDEEPQMTSVLDTYLASLDPQRADKAPLIRELDRIVRAHGPALVADIRYRILLYALEGDYRTWVCAVDATKKGACLRFLFGTQLSDPQQRLRAGSATLASLDFARLEEIDAAQIAPYVQEAVARYAEARVWLREQEAERRRQKAAQRDTVS